MSPAHARARQTWQQLRATWAARSARERTAITSAAAVVGAALLWSVALAPAIHTLQQAPAQLQAAEADLARMRALGRSAEALQAVPAVDGPAAARQFQETTERVLGRAARVAQTGTLVRVSLEHVRAADLAQWLADVRTNAHLLPAEAELTRDAPDGAAAAWSGTLSFNLPA